MCLRNEGVLLIGPLDDDISKSTAAERRLLDFSGGVVYICGILFTDWAKKTRPSHLASSKSRSQRYWGRTYGYFILHCLGQKKLAVINEENSGVFYFALQKKLAVINRKTRPWHLSLYVTMINQYEQQRCIID